MADEIQHNEGLALNNTVILLAAPNGTGKGSVINELLQEPKIDLVKCPRVTSRVKGDLEIDGEDYFFVSDEEFERQVQTGDFLEHKRNTPGYYGTSLSMLIERCRMHQSVILDLDVEAAVAIEPVLRALGINCVSILLIPESVQDFISDQRFQNALRILERRQRARNRGESDEEIRLRLVNAVSMFSKYQLFDYIVENEDGKLTEAVEAIKQIIQPT